MSKLRERFEGEVCKTPQGVWMDKATGESVARRIAVEAMMALGLDHTDFRLRDRVIAAISRRVDGSIQAALEPVRELVGGEPPPALLGYNCEQAYRRGWEEFRLQLAKLLEE